MADGSDISKFLGNVADAIRHKKGTTGPIPAQDFDKEIRTIPTAKVQSVKSAYPSTESITVTPDTGFDGIANVIVYAVTSNIDKNILPDNIAEGVTILGVNGRAKVLDTFDATAVARDIAEGETAYVKGLKVIGSLSEYVSGGSLYGPLGASTITEDTAGVWATGNPAKDQIVRQGVPVTFTLDKSELATALGITSDKIGKGYTILGITGNLKADTEYQVKELEVTKDGTYIIKPDEGYDGLSSVTVDVAVASSMEVQHMPFYLLESDNEGNLWCVNNYATMEYVPYSLDVDGNLIVNQDDGDSAVYWINENMELEVEISG